MPTLSNLNPFSIVESSSSERVSIFIPDLSVGGAQRVTINLAEALNDDGFKVELLVADASGKFSSDISNDIKIIELKNIVPVLGVLGVVPSLRSHLKHSESAVLISSLTRANVTAILAQQLLSSKILSVGIEHLNITEKDTTVRGQVTFKLAKILYSNLDAIVAVSEGVAASISNEFKIDRTDISVIPNIVITDEFRTQAASAVDHRWTDDEFELIVSLGRLSDQKDYPTLLKAFSKVENDDARLLIIGEGELRDELMQLSRRLKIQEKVEFAGYVDNPYKYINDASLFVLSSKREGLPTVLIEALGCGCPIVSTDSPSGPSEVLDYGRYGHLIPIGDPDRLAGAIDAELSKTHDETILLERADHYSAKTVIPMFKQLM